VRTESDAPSIPFDISSRSRRVFTFIGVGVGVTLAFLSVGSSNKDRLARAEAEYLPKRNEKASLILKGIAPRATENQALAAAGIISAHSPIRDNSTFPDITGCFQGARIKKAPSATMSTTNGQTQLTEATTYDNLKLTTCLNALSTSSALPASVQREKKVTQADMTIRYIIPTPAGGALGGLIFNVVASVAAMGGSAARRRYNLK